MDRGNLVLVLEPGDKIFIDNQITITFIKIKGKEFISVGVEAPKTMTIKKHWARHQPAAVVGDTVGNV